MSGKGCKRRPQQISEEKMQSNWEKAFNKGNKKKK